MILANRYKIIEKIGEGNFGEIYKGLNVRTNELIAIKKENKDNKSLKNEAKLYQYLGCIEGFIKIKWFGIYLQENYLVMDLLDISLLTFKNINQNIDNEKIETIGKQMIKRIEYLHKKGLIHRDIKPENFVFGLNNKKDLLYLIDLGFCKRFYNDDGQHKPNKKLNNIIGTPLFVSLNIHNLNQPSRRDDIESVIYIILYLMNKMSWYNLLDNNKKQTEIIIKLKEDIINNKEIPNNLLIILHYVRNLKYDELPNYEYIYNNIIL
jgi:serine/threonine protein kinase